jgi:surface protein
MANIAASPDWYNRSGMKNYRTEITEVAVVNSYAPTGHEIVSWDASAELNGTVTAYIVDTKLILVCDLLTDIPDMMFYAFLSLERASGLESIKTIGDYAFMLTPKLASIDLAWSGLTAVGNDAFRSSGIEDKYDLSSLASDIVGDRATRGKRWSAAGLEAVRAVPFPSNKILLSVQNIDSQFKYKDVPYVTVNGEVKTVKENGCRSLVYYHIWNALYYKTDKEYPDFITWFNDKLNRDGKYHENTDMSDACNLRDLATLGWTRNSVARIISAEQLEYIVSELANGLPVHAIMQGVGTGYHSIAVIGCDHDTRKLAIVDSAVRPDKGVVYWVAYEDLFTEGAAEASECICKIDFNLPLLAKSDTWFTQGETGVARNSITQIDIVLSYTPTGNETASWDASAKKNGSVMCYVNGTKLTIAGNGDNYVYANLDSSWAFSDSARKDYFTNVTNIYGGGLLNTHKATTMQQMFRECGALTTIDTSNWDTSSVETMQNMFNRCNNLTELDVSNWDTSKVVSIGGMFYRSNTSFYLTTLDTSKWNTCRMTSMTQAFANCGALTTIGDTSNWDTSSVETMTQMFAGCVNLKAIDASGWDTTSCSDMSGMFLNTRRLEQVSVGDKFSFKSGSLLPATDANTIPGADGNWYTRNRTPYAPADIPNMTANTYYATKNLVNDIDILIKNGSVLDIADTIRSRTGKTEKLNLEDFVTEISSIRIGFDYTNQHVTQILPYTFYGCESLNTVQCCNLESIGERAFEGCINLESIELPGSLTSIGTAAFYKCAKLALTNLPDGITSISDGAFSGCGNIALTELPDSITDIGISAFNSCTNLALTELLDGINTIGNYAFYRCTSLTSITFNGTPNTISSSAFSNCTNLLTINVPWSEGEVAGAPWGATNATINYNYTVEPEAISTWDISATENDNVTAALYGSTDNYSLRISGTGNMEDFYGEFGKPWYDVKDNISSVTIADGITSIGSDAFSSCENIESIELPNGITSIGDVAFAGCTNLALTKLPDGITSIGDMAFYKCNKLALTELPDSITSIGDIAFNGCTNLTSITFNGTPNTISSSAFDSCTNLLTINVPWSEGEVANAPWGATNATINYSHVGNS